MDRQSNAYVFVFAIIVCVACGVLLSAVSEGLRKQQELNVVLDVKKNILKAVVLKEAIPATAKAADILKIYQEKIQELVVDEKGNIVDGKKPSDIKESEKDLHPIYIYKEDGQIASYAFPIVGQGLWSTLYGYLALEGDAATVRGITFYKHGETPGLGGEIEKDWFQNNFKGKKIWSVKENTLKPIVVVKGKAADLYKGEEASYYVDGITAATLTGNGVTEMLDRGVRVYEPYLGKLRKI